MAFRADEAVERGFEAVKEYLIPKEFGLGERVRSEAKLMEIIDKYGPVVESYPSWHPLMANNSDKNWPSTTPDKRCGYIGLDHTRYFAHAFVTCPYGDGQDVIKSVEALCQDNEAYISAEALDVKFYNEDTTPILVTCKWRRELEEGQMVPSAIAVPRMLEKELPCRLWAQRGETWDSMRGYFLGSPHGKRSSLFVSQETAIAMKKIWDLLQATGAFGTYD